MIALATVIYLLIGCLILGAAYSEEFFKGQYDKIGLAAACTAIFLWPAALVLALGINLGRGQK